MADKIETIKSKSEDMLIELLDSASDEGLNMEQATHKLKVAKLGLQTVQAKEISERINNGQIIRVIGFVSEDTKQRREYIQAAMPQMLPSGN